MKYIIKILFFLFCLPLQIYTMDFRKQFIDEMKLNVNDLKKDLHAKGYEDKISAFEIVLRNIIEEANKVKSFGEKEYIQMTKTAAPVLAQCNEAIRNLNKKSSKYKPIYMSVKKTKTEKSRLDESDELLEKARKKIVK